jgi:superfamily II DNA helicase RecQ
MMRDERQHLVEQTNMTEALQRMTGQPTMQFRGVQEAAIQSIQAGHSRVVVVMPTGGGKSMLFMLPAWVAQRGGLTVVVVPLTALRTDLQQRCQAAGIPCIE